MAERVVKHGLFEYTTPKGERAIAFRGDTISLDGEELARAEEVDAVVESVEDLPVVLADPEPPSVVEVVGPSSSPVGALPDARLADSVAPETVLEGPVEAPPKAAGKEAWVEFRFEQADGAVSREDLDGLSKAELQDDAKVAELRS